MFDRINKGRWWDIGLTLVEGCTRVSEACRNCWALDMEKRFQKNIHNIRFRPERIKRISEEKPTAFAIWNDLFHHDMRDRDIFECITLFWLHPEHIFLILTKRPQIANAMFKSITLPHNIWIGTTAENQKAANSRIPALLNITAPVRFVSVEPMLSPVDLSDFLPSKGIPKRDGLEWVICGCESGPKRRPTKESWIGDLCNQCYSANVSFFLKQMKVDRKVQKMPNFGGRIWNQVPER